MPRKSTFMDATVARGFMFDCTVRGCTEITVTFTRRFGGLVMITSSEISTRLGDNKADVRVMVINT